MMKTFKVEKISAYDNKDGTICVIGKYEVHADSKDNAILQLNPKAKIINNGVGLLPCKDILVVMKEI